MTLSLTQHCTRHDIQHCTLHDTWGCARRLAAVQVYKRLICDEGDCCRAREPLEADCIHSPSRASFSASPQPMAITSQVKDSPALQSPPLPAILLPWLPPVGATASTSASFDRRTELRVRTEQNKKAAATRRNQSGPRGLPCGGWVLVTL